MKYGFSIPLAFVSALVLPRARQEEKAPSDFVTLQRDLIKQELRVAELKRLADKIRAGENADLPETLLPSEATETSPERLQALREEVIRLQEEFESLGLIEDPQPNEKDAAAKPSTTADAGVKTYPLTQVDSIRLASALFRLGKYQEAYDLFSAEQGPWPAFYAARCLEMLDRPEEASGAYKKVGEAHPGTAAAKQAELSMIYLQKRLKLGRPSDYDELLVRIAAELIDDGRGSKK